MRIRFLAGLTLAFSILGLFALTHAETITKPHTFTDGTPAMATEVNANFDIVYDQVNKVGTEVHIDSTNHRVGIGTQNPGAKLTVAGEGELIANAVVAYGGTSGSDVIPVFVGARARGTHSAPTAVQQGDLLTLFVSKGHMGTGFTYWSNAGIIIKAAENFSETNQGTKINFLTTPNGAINKQTRMTIDHNGNVGIGTTNPVSKLTIVGEGEKIVNKIVAYGGSEGIGNDVFPVYAGLRARGSAASPTAVQPGDIFAYFGGKGYDGSQWPALSTAGISMVATEAYTGTSQGSKIVFLTTPNGSTSKRTSVVITPDGTLKQVNGYTQLALTPGSPNSGDCDNAEEYGRMKVDATAGSLYICVASGWVAK